MARLGCSNANRGGSRAITIHVYVLVLVLVVCGQLAAWAKAQQGGGLPTLSPEELQKLLADVKQAGYNDAGLMIEALSSNIPSQTTLLIPTDAAISAYLRGSDIRSQVGLPRLLQYHVVTKLLPFQALSRIPAGQRLPTLLSGYSVVVTDNRTGSYKVDNALVAKPNLCINTTTLACHGIDSILDLKYGRADISGPLPPPLTAPPLLAPLFAPTPGGPAIIPPVLTPLLAPGILLPPVSSPPEVPGPEGAQPPSAAFSLKGEHPCMQQMMFLALLGWCTFWLL
ncbi:hypothetical protein O6H91_08G009300 [Diphasiastrum complanatum]|uniref:Uncharacterized protein n=1 Tax=Diphasiastrum complanatum TaxID=34168 RepID=A0ACC2CUW3_DIPCM|nr:hypothetical protein O6H91_08G009300 [Diphasiastrum complanatum]